MKRKKGTNKLVLLEYTSKMVSTPFASAAYKSLSLYNNLSAISDIFNSHNISL